MAGRDRPFGAHGPAGSVLPFQVILVWLLPVLPAIARACLEVFYRIDVDGPRPAERGPLLLVANHPNSLLDPAFVLAFAERPVRFLAKAPLFDQRDIGWLVRAAGSIPVHRPQDDPGRLKENQRAFGAAEDALLAGGAIGIFPEGLTHDEPRLSPLKTGAARIALGTALGFGGSFPIVPVGLSFPEKGIFRSPALVVRGEPIAWDDLAEAGPEDVEAVRALTARIDDGLRSVTLNLERWEDHEIVVGAEAIYAAVHGADPSPVRRLERQRIATEHLARLRAAGSPVHLEVSEGVRRHMARLSRLGLTPTDLMADDPPRGSGDGRSPGSAMLATLARVAAWIGGIVFYPPYRLTGRVQAAMKPDNTAVATHKLLVGVVAFALWALLLIVAAGWLGGWFAAGAVAVTLPLVGIATLWMQDRSAEALRRARTRWIVQRRSVLVRSLRERQVGLARQLAELHQSAAASVSASVPAPSPPREGPPGP